MFERCSPSHTATASAAVTSILNKNCGQAEGRRSRGSSTSMRESSAASKSASHK